jgi:hypothetical protein
MSPVSSAVWRIRLRSLSFTNGCFPWSVNSFCYSGQVEFTSCYVVSCVGCIWTFSFKILKTTLMVSRHTHVSWGGVSVLSSYCLPDVWGAEWNQEFWKISYATDQRVVRNETIVTTLPRLLSPWRQPPFRAHKQLILLLRLPYWCCLTN